MSQVTQTHPSPVEDEPEEVIIPSLYSLAGGIMQLAAIVVIAVLFLLTSVPHMDSFKEMNPSDALEPEVRAYLYVFNGLCWINISTALIGIIKSREERMKIAVVAFLASGVCLGTNLLVPYLF